MFICTGKTASETEGKEIYLVEFVEVDLSTIAARRFPRDIRDTITAGKRIAGWGCSGGSWALTRLRSLSDVAGVSCTMTSSCSFVIARRRHGGCMIYFRLPSFAPFVSCRRFSCRCAGSRLPCDSILHASISLETPHGFLAYENFIIIRKGKRNRRRTK